jgi:hypothetical protein
MTDPAALTLPRALHGTDIPPWVDDTTRSVLHTLIHYPCDYTVMYRDPDELITPEQVRNASRVFNTHCHHVDTRDYSHLLQVLCALTHNIRSYEVLRSQTTIHRWKDSGKIKSRYLSQSEGLLHTH